MCLACLSIKFIKSSSSFKICLLNFNNSFICWNLWANPYLVSKCPQKTGNQLKLTKCHLNNLNILWGGEDMQYTILYAWKQSRKCVFDKVGVCLICSESSSWSWWPPHHLDQSTYSVPTLATSHLSCPFILWDTKLKLRKSFFLYYWWINMSVSC